MSCPHAPALVHCSQAFMVLLSNRLAAMYVVVLGYFTAAGAGRFSVDEQVLGGELELYQGLADKLRGGPMDS